MNGLQIVGVVFAVIGALVPFAGMCVWIGALHAKTIAQGREIRDLKEQHTEHRSETSGLRDALNEFAQTVTGAISELKATVTALHTTVQGLSDARSLADRHAHAGGRVPEIAEANNLFAAMRVLKEMGWKPA